MNKEDYEILVRLTGPQGFSSETPKLLESFSRSFGWRPSYRIDDPASASFVNAHVMMEHGLQDAAVISFLRGSRFSDLSMENVKYLATVSYNNLVDWNIIVQNDEINIIYNRSTRLFPETRLLNIDNFEALKYDHFLRAISKRPNPNISALDDALIERISFWKRNISLKMGRVVDNRVLSNFFNTIFFIRSVEDYRRANGMAVESNLLEKAASSVSTGSTVKDVFMAAIAKLQGITAPDYLYDETLLSDLDAFPIMDALELFKDFYGNKLYKYDFSLIGKHALGKIYEKYVANLRVIETKMPTLFPMPPTEVANRELGAVYTPQYIANFFSRVLIDSHAPSDLPGLVTVDHACGSGIFPRSFLENANYTFNSLSNGLTPIAFENSWAIDIDYSATQATRLSLALLHLSINGSFPPTLNVINEDALDILNKMPDLRDTFDAVMSNPPYIPVEELGTEEKDKVVSALDNFYGGRQESYLAFMNIALRLLKPGGQAFFVVPHAFLLNENANLLRNHISEDFTIRYLIDLTKIKVFENVSTYVILLIIQKAKPTVEHSLIYAQVRDFPGHALEAILDGFEITDPNYSIYRVLQNQFKNSQWKPIPSSLYVIQAKIEQNSPLKNHITPKQGFNTGDDEVFIRLEKAVPASERVLYMKYMPDKKITRFVLPESTGELVFYPYLDEKEITFDSVSKYKNTYLHLSAQRENRLQKSRVNESNWWKPERPRQPKDIRVPKIVAPHLLLSPRFALDLSGEYAVKRSIYFIIKDRKKFDHEQEVRLLKFYCGIMNSEVFMWQLERNSQKYGSGYSLIEQKTLTDVYVPNIDNSDVILVDSMIKEIDQVIATGKESWDNRRNIDQLALLLYGLSSGDLDTLRGPSAY
ncbi:HsdM family class I SAM-dependent methyltransferase [Deinococcus arcticus]|uniref:site-specific DNA-methyltransferase (adenine-specific) n=1 Tax=Deinococcus arcticus TaxID=2136176 RepID=A0A2T3WAG5_9DEIO|nr:N-6 DNA methylase [Deinococcus arcticus]PTA68900.1 hypothetical protein C8263_06315 [Deinococcus arcticus]